MSEIRMVDVGAKPVSKRRAVARARVLIPASVRERIAAGTLPKGDVLAVARIAGIMAAKRTPEIVPLCHPLPLTRVDVTPELDDEGVTITTAAETTAQTGVEMEALTAAAAAALTVYDMTKGLDPSIEIASVHLLEKSGGKSGHWTRDPA
ncbi:MAG TPA: cyclic pyranopterin monophosphate synthase MoaC [Gaiellales bacterium]|nr:cyclic pyranopterin monophosphate synthase MoaC [Gaiellales bacterium]